MDGVPLDPQLAQAATRALGRYGYAGTTVERIAREAGLSRVTLHRRGLSKELIIGALTERAIDHYRKAMWPALTAPGTGRERLECALRALCGTAEDNLELLAALAAQSDAIFHEDEQGPRTRPVFTEPLERLLRDGAADGTLAAGDPAEQATLLFNVVGWSYVHLRTGHRWEPEKTCRHLLDLALHGLTAHSQAHDAA